MTDDIVIRLRDWVLCDTPTEMVMLEAADEIERLRELVADYRNLYRLRAQLGDAVSR